jgi:hypothetical protein
VSKAQWKNKNLPKNEGWNLLSFFYSSWENWKLRRHNYLWAFRNRMVYFWCRLGQISYLINCVECHHSDWFHEWVLSRSYFLVNHKASKEIYWKIFQIVFYIFRENILKLLTFYLVIKKPLRGKLNLLQYHQHIPRESKIYRK